MVRGGAGPAHGGGGRGGPPAGGSAAGPPPGWWAGGGGGGGGGPPTGGEAAGDRPPEALPLSTPRVAGRAVAAGRSGRPRSSLRTSESQRTASCHVHRLITPGSRSRYEPVTRGMVPGDLCQTHVVR